ncbi:MAG: hypothetical protein H7Y38_06695 [Armatimonadetes bacterium]|nr:hypothetical protein [Armatimonadota bacterium]
MEQESTVDCNCICTHWTRSSDSALLSNDCYQHMKKFNPTSNYVLTWMILGSYGNFFLLRKPFVWLGLIIPIIVFVLLIWLCVSACDAEKPRLDVHSGEIESDANAVFSKATEERDIKAMLIKRIFFSTVIFAPIPLVAFFVS